jgi:hypothetical protein
LLDLHENFQRLLRDHPAVRLLRKDTAPLIVTFLWSAFRDQRHAAYGSRELTTKLEDLLFALTDAGQNYTRPARDYLEAWTEDNFLRQFYEADADEATFELTAAGERVLQWVAELDKPEFVGAESRLRQVFDQLRQLAENTTEDATARRQQLETRRAEIDAQLVALDRGDFDKLGDTGIRERFLLIEDTASRLLSDFRAIEDNFRRLNAAAREELLQQHTSRGEVLEHIFDSRKRILDSDQGRTFAAFWEFLMDQRRREEQEKHLAQLAGLPELNDLYGRAFLPRMETALVDAGDRVNRTTERLVEQLRRFVQSRAFSENQRVTNLIGKIERLAVAVKTDPPPNRRFARIDGAAVVNLTMDRGVFNPPARLDLRGAKPLAGDASEVVTTALYDQQYVDPAELRGRLDALLRDRRQISLAEVAEAIPPRRGLTELLTYFSIATHRETERRAIINPEREETITYTVGKTTRTATFPETIFLNE